MFKISRREEVHIMTSEMFKSTLDLDLVDKVFLNHALYRISKCKFLHLVHYRHTFKGFHVILLCRRECDICRIVFDDQARFARDLLRPKHTRNVLFNVSKEFIPRKRCQIYLHAV